MGQRTIYDLPWRDGAQFTDRDWLVRMVMGDYENGCVACGAEQPNDAEWTYHTVVFRRKDSGKTRKIEVATCPACKLEVDRVLGGV